MREGGRQERRLLRASAGQDAVDRFQAPLENPPQTCHLRLRRGKTHAVPLKLEAQNGLTVLWHQAQESGAVGAHPLGRGLRV